MESVYFALRKFLILIELIISNSYKVFTWNSEIVIYYNQGGVIMKITCNNGVDVTRIYNDNKSLSICDKEKVNRKYDTLEISKEGQEIARFVTIAKNMADIRAQKIEDIKNRIESGKYNVSSEELASKIIQTIKGENI